MITKRYLREVVRALEYKVEKQQDIIDLQAKIIRNLSGGVNSKDTLNRPSYSHMNSKGVVYYLNKKQVRLRQGKLVQTYYFSKDLRNTATTLPIDYEVFETTLNGFPMIRKRK